MMRYGIPGYRTPRDLLDKEIERIINLGDIEVVTGKRVGKDLPLDDIEKSHDAVLWTIGCWNGKAIPVEGGDATNCITGVDFLEAFCDGRLKVGSKKVICVGGGDTSIDVVSVAQAREYYNSLDARQKAKVKFEDIKSYYVNGRAVLIQGRVNSNTAIEEILHPFVDAIKVENSELFDNLLEESKETFLIKYQ